MGTVVRYRMAVVLLTAALLATLTVALTGGQPATAVTGPVDVVYVATGRNFPDALAGSTLATSANAPLLTVEKDLPIPQATIDALTALDPGRIVVFGGPVAVSNDVATALETYTRSGDVTRLFGTDRHATAAAIADALPDTVDADTLAGLPAQDVTGIDLPLTGMDRNSNATYQHGFGIQLERVAGSVSAFYGTFVVPPTKPAGARTLMDVKWFVQESGCTYTFEAGKPYVFQPDGRLDTVDFQRPGDTDRLTASAPTQVTSTATFELVGLDPSTDDEELLAPGDAVHFFFRRGGNADDTCTLSDLQIVGVSVRFVP